MPPRLRDDKGRFLRQPVDQAIDSIIGPIEPTEDKESWDTIREGLDAASDTIAALHEELQQKDIVSAITGAGQYNEKRSAEKRLEEAEKKIKQLEEEASVAKGLKTLDIYEDEDEDISIKVAKPEPFDGKSEKVEPFLAACDLVFKTQTKKFAGTKSKVYYVLSYCNQGAALLWKERVLQDMRYISDDIAAVQVEDKCDAWPAFKTIFRKLWKGASARQEAQVELQNLRQGTDSVQEYITRFSLVAQETGFNEETKIVFFKRGLKEVIKQRIFDSGNIPTSFREWGHRALTIDTAWRVSQIERRGMGKPNWENKGRVRFTKPEGQQRERLPPEIYQKRRKEGLCYVCGNKGHMAKDCYAAKGRRTQPDPDKEEGAKETNNQDFH